MNQPITINPLLEKKQQQQKWAMLAVYDASMAALCEKAGVDMLLIGDSLGMVIQGHRSTVPVTLNDICYHAQAVRRGAPNLPLMVDMPFMSYADEKTVLQNAQQLMQQADASILKMECNESHIWLINRLRENGVPICAHIGLTPQFIYQLGRYRKFGKPQTDERKALLTLAKDLADAGAAMLLLEMVDHSLAEIITQVVDIPVIGIGAGIATDAQVLVIYDILGISAYIPSFSHNFLAQTASVEAAISAYTQAVHEKRFPFDAKKT